VLFSFTTIFNSYWYKAMSHAPNPQQFSGWAQHVIKIDFL
jgi:hypothetical protein